MLRKRRMRPSYANVVATLALIFAMSGGAYAAGRYLVTSTKQIKPNVLKQLRGVSGTRGAQGAQGSAGPQGPQGSAGSQGPAGAKGETGATGAAGKEGPPGKDGAPGKDGTTGFTETLPSGKTETGTWAVSVFGASEQKFAAAPISFAIPLASGGEAVFLNAEETEENAGTGGCTGTIAAPTAPKGKLCVYTEFESNEKLVDPPLVQAEETLHHYGKAGGFVAFALEPAGSASSLGVWAVQAP